MARAPLPMAACRVALATAQPSIPLPRLAMFKRIAHVCLHVRDLSRALAYYERLGLCRKFGFTRNGERFGAYMEISDGNYIEMFEDKERGPVVNNGLRHFCLEAEDLDAVMRQLRERDIPHTEKKLGCDGTWQIWLEDPDGNAFEVHQYTGESAQLHGQTVEADW